MVEHVLSLLVVFFKRFWSFAFSIKFWNQFFNFHRKFVQILIRLQINSGRIGSFYNIKSLYPQLNQLYFFICLGLFTFSPSLIVFCRVFSFIRFILVSYLICSNAIIFKEFCFLFYVQKYNLAFNIYLLDDNLVEFILIIFLWSCFWIFYNNLVQIETVLFFLFQTSNLNLSLSFLWPHCVTCGISSLTRDGTLTFCIGNMES